MSELRRVETAQSWRRASTVGALAQAGLNSCGRRRAAHFESAMNSCLTDFSPRRAQYCPSDGSRALTALTHLMSASLKSLRSCRPSLILRLR